MGKIYFLRHGQSVWNVENKICGRTDIPLTDEGRRQASMMGRNIQEEGIRIDEILCSPLSRAEETARIIAGILGAPLRVEPRLTEQDFGIYESTPRRQNPAFVDAKRKYFKAVGGGESAMRVSHRIYGLLDELTKEPGRSILLVSHNGIAGVVHSYFHEMENEEYSTFGIQNCSMNCYDY